MTKQETVVGFGNVVLKTSDIKLKTSDCRDEPCAGQFAPVPVIPVTE